MAPGGGKDYHSPAIRIRRSAGDTPLIRHDHRIGIAWAAAAALAAMLGRTAVAVEEPAGPETLTSAEASALARELAPTVETLRGLAFKAPVDVKVVDDDAARKHFKSRMDAFWPEKRVRAEQVAFTQLGLLPAGTDLLDGLFEILEEQVGGFYDPDSDTFFVLDDMPKKLAPVIMVHELTHALDDQHYGIDDLIDKTIDDEDRSSALAAVVEGSGTLVMSTWLLREVQSGRMSPGFLESFQESEAVRAEKLKAAAPYLQRGLLSPYLLGQTFLLKGNFLMLAAGVVPADIDRAFREPPLSTEQILHPDKYWREPDRDPPRKIATNGLESSLGEGWTSEEQGSLGEMNLAILAGAGPLDPESPALLSPAAWTNEAASGWAGDAWRLYSLGDRRVTLLVTAWDTADDAVEFEAALPPLAGRSVFRSGDVVILVAGDHAGRDEHLSRAAFRLVGGAP